MYPEFDFVVRAEVVDSENDGYRPPVGVKHVSPDFITDNQIDGIARHTVLAKENKNATLYSVGSEFFTTYRLWD